MLKEHHYKSHPVIWEIVLDPDDMNQTLDMTPGSIGNISKSLDYPTISKYRVGECTIKFNDPEGVFSVNNSNNYFVMNRLPQSGYKVGILIKTGFIVDGVRELATYFNGNIIRINQNIGDATTELICVDKIRDLYVDDLKNYGIHRKFGIKSDSNIDSQHGIYPIMPALLPASEDSIIATRDLNQELNLVDELSSEGDINTDNYIVSEDRLESERGIIVQRDADGNAILGDDGEPLRPSTGFPQIELKSPQRYIVLNALIKDILSESNITNYSIDIPNQEVDHHFSSNGRVFYDLISSRDNTRRVQGIGSSVSATWEGYPTDAIVYDGKYYFLYNSFKINRHISNTVTQVSPLDGSSIIEYDPSIGQYRQIFHARPIKDGNYISTKEFWKFAVKDVSDTVNGFYIIATESRVSRLTGIPRDGSYDSRQTGNEVHILEVQIPKTIQNSHYDNIDIDNDNGFSIFDHDDSSVSVFVPSNVILKPQLAHYYHISKRSSRRNMVPDSRRNLIWYEHPSDNTQHGLFYAYVDASNNKFGIARARSGNSQQAFIEADIDIRFNKALENHAGINFSIEDDILSGAITCRTTMTSGNVPTSAVTRFEKPLTT